MMIQIRCRPNGT